MFKTASKVLRDWFTGVDGETYDLGRSIWAGAMTTPVLAGSVQVMGSVRSLWTTVPLSLWSAQDWSLWCAGTSGLLAAGAGALYMKRITEPSVTTSKVVIAEAGGANGSVTGTATEQSTG